MRNQTSTRDVNNTGCCHLKLFATNILITVQNLQRLLQNLNEKKNIKLGKQGLAQIDDKLIKKSRPLWLVFWISLIVPARWKASTRVFMFLIPVNKSLSTLMMSHVLQKLVMDSWKPKMIWFKNIFQIRSSNNSSTNTLIQIWSLVFEFSLVLQN